MDTSPSSAAPAARHETRDADIRSLVIFAAVLAGTVLLVSRQLASGWFSRSDNGIRRWFRIARERIRTQTRFH